MKLRTLMMLSATGMAATAATVWMTVEPARGSVPVTGEAPIAPPVNAPPTEDLSHFQAGKTLMMEGRLGHAVLPANVDTQTYLFVDVAAAEAVARKPAPLDLSIVIDKSGSMAGKRMTNAIAAARTALDRLRDGDMVSLVSFDTTTEVVVSPTVIDADSRKRVAAKIATIATNGGDTCISCGVETAMGLLGQRAGMVKRMLVLSDGIPDGPGTSAGVRDVEGFQRIAENCRRMGAAVTTIGVDVGYDEKILAALARGSNGHHFFVADPSGLPSIFDQEMATHAKTVANRAELTIDLAPGVFADHVFDRASTGDGSQIVVPLGSFAASDHKTLLVRLRVPRGGTGDRPIAAVRMRYDDLVESKDGNCEGKLLARMTTDTTALTPLDGLVSARLSATEAADALEKANDLFREGRAIEARDLLERERTRIRGARKDAAKATPKDRWGDVDRAFGANDDRLGKGSAAFRPSKLKPAADPFGQAQVRNNQVESNMARD